MFGKKSKKTNKKEVYKTTFDEIFIMKYRDKDGTIHTFDIRDYDKYREIMSNHELTLIC